MIQGAEAEVTVKEEKVIKERPEKNYRHPELDKRIRRQRTQTEHSTLKKSLRNSVNVPKVEKTSEYRLKLEKIDGKTLEEEFRPEKLKDVGKNLEKLHESGLIHGDLTTSNIIANEEIYIIDFGLSQESSKTEDRAVDLHLLKQMLQSSHPENFEEAWNNFLKDYRPEFREEVLERLNDVEERGRYK
ncbi:MAG: KEOPS complex kinase/ATPase Bud32 [Candidatus Nanohaloarchaea archaeon]